MYCVDRAPVRYPGGTVLNSSCTRTFAGATMKYHTKSGDTLVVPTDIEKIVAVEYLDNEVVAERIFIRVKQIHPVCVLIHTPTDCSCLLYRDGINACRKEMSGSDRGEFDITCIRNVVVDILDCTDSTTAEMVRDFFDAHAGEVTDIYHDGNSTELCDRIQSSVPRFIINNILDVTNQFAYLDNNTRGFVWQTLDDTFNVHYPEEYKPIALDRLSCIHRDTPELTDKQLYRHWGRVPDRFKDSLNLDEGRATEFQLVTTFDDRLIEFCQCIQWMMSGEICFKYTLLEGNGKLAITYLKSYLTYSKEEIKIWECQIKYVLSQLRPQCTALSVCKTHLGELFFVIHSSRGDEKYFVDLCLLPVLSRTVVTNVNCEDL